MLWNHGIDVRGFGGDTMHMARLWDASRLSGYSLEALTNELVGRRKAPMKELFGVPVMRSDGTPGKTISMPPVEELQNSPLSRPEWIQYSCYDSQGTWLLHEQLSNRLQAMEWQVCDACGARARRLPPPPPPLPRPLRPLCHAAPRHHVSTRPSGP